MLGLLELNRNNNYDTPGEQISEILGGIGISPKSAQKGKEILEIKTDVPVAPSKSLSSSLPQSTSRPMSEAERHTTFNNLLERGYKEYQVPVKASITFVSGLRQELYIFAEDTSSYMLGSSPTPDDMMKAKKEHIKEVVKQ